MIKITNGRETLDVSRGAYKALYKSAGFACVHPEQEAHDGVYGADNAAIPLSERPLMDMSADELKAYATELGIDHEHTRTKKDMQALIREHLQVGKS